MSSPSLLDTPLMEEIRKVRQAEPVQRGWFLATVARGRFNNSVGWVAGARGMGRCTRVTSLHAPQHSPPSHTGDFFEVLSLLALSAVDPGQWEVLVATTTCCGFLCQRPGLAD
jgi:hypothetical protein